MQNYAKPLEEIQKPRLVMPKPTLSWPILSIICRRRSRRFIGQNSKRLRSNLNVPSEDREISVNAIENGDVGKKSPTGETESFKQTQTWLVMHENQADHRPDLKT